MLKIMQRARKSLDRASETAEKTKGNIGGKNMELRGGGGRVLEVGGLWRWEDFGGGGGLGGEVEGLGKEK